MSPTDPPIAPLPEPAPNPYETVHKDKSLLITVLIAALVAIVASAVTVYFSQRAFNRVELTTPYQAVLMTGGAAYFGKLEGLGTPYPVLKEVYYVQTRQNPETKQTSNTLVQRSREMHGPDRMIINANDIVFIEPVNPNSRLAQLIAEAKTK